VKLSAKLAIFFLPFVGIYGLPAIVLAASGEILAADEIAARHFEGPRTAVYGAAYTNPDARYKLVMLELHKPRVVAIGSSRTEQFRSDMFDRTAAFYNAGLLTERLYEFRRALAHLPEGNVESLILILDQWSFNANWPNSADNVLFEKEIAAGSSNALNAVQRGARTIWPHVLSGYLPLAEALSRNDNIGVSGRVRGNGFRWDGSYAYTDFARVRATLPDFEFKDTLKRIERGERRFEPGDDVDPNAITELRELLAAARARGLNVVAILPPFAPTVERALRASPRHAYVQKIHAAIAPVFAAAGYRVVDFTSCEALGCSDEEFYDGFHPGPKADARLLARLADEVPWLDAIVDQDELRMRVARAGAGTELSEVLAP
jgi:hypothetical protein